MGQVELPGPTGVDDSCGLDYCLVEVHHGGVVGYAASELLERNDNRLAAAEGD